FFSLSFVMWRSPKWIQLTTSCSAAAAPEYVATKKRGRSSFVLLRSPAEIMEASHRVARALAAIPDAQPGQCPPSWPLAFERTSERVKTYDAHEMLSGLGSTAGDGSQPCVR